jgi:hypothetical protein
MFSATAPAIRPIAPSTVQIRSIVAPPLPLGQTFFLAKLLSAIEAVYYF